MKRIYCISGLGADERAFQKLSVKGAEIVPVKWCSFDKHDDLQCYAQKMSSTIKEDKPIILGLSFGGMLATEISKMRETTKVFLVSSAKRSDELPDSSGLLKFIVNNKILPDWLVTMPNSKMLDLLGAKTDDEKKLLSAIVRDSDPALMKWAFKAILHWENFTYPPNITHIHGTADKVIPPENVNADYWIEGGEHMMIYSRGAEVSAIIEQHI